MWPNSWEIAAVLCKLVLYLGAAGVAGAGLTLLRYRGENHLTVSRTLAYMAMSALLGFHGALVGFGVQIGMINQRGIPGMFDWTMGSILLDTSQGAAATYRLGAFLLALATVAFGYWKIQTASRRPTERFYQGLFVVSLLSLLALAYSFRIIGHVSVLPC